MKATSKLISVVLILALCLSMFTVSAFAQTVVTAPMEEGGRVAGNSYTGGGYGQKEVNQSNDKDNVQEPVEKNVVAPVDIGFVEVATADELKAALEADSANIRLTAQIAWVGVLNLDKDVKIDLGGKGNGLAFSGSGDAAIISRANAEFFNGNIFVSGASATAESEEVVPGFLTVADSVEGGSVYLHGVYVKFTEAGGNSIFGDGIRLGNGTFSQNVAKYYAEGELDENYVVADETENGGMYDVTAKEVVPAANDNTNENSGSQVAEDGKVEPLVGTCVTEEGTITVTISGKNLPEGLSVEVKPMDKSVLQAGEGEEVLFVVDITLFQIDENGEKQVYEPADDPNVSEVNVTIRHPALGNVEEGEAVTLYHIVKGDAIPVASAEEVQGENALEFSTDSFSPYGAIVTSTASDGDIHYRKVNVNSPEIYVIDSGGLTINFSGGKAPEKVSIVPYSVANNGDYYTYVAGLLDFAADPDSTTVNGTDYDLVGTPPNITGIKIKDTALANAPEGKFGVVLWFKDIDDDGTVTRVYLVQPVILVRDDGVFGEGDNFTPTDADLSGNTGDFDVEMCDQGSVKVKLTDKLQYFTITGGKVSVYYNATTNPKKILIDGKPYNASEYFTVEENVTTDAVGHEFVSGKVLTLSQSLIKKIGVGENIQLVVQQEDGTGAKDKGTFNLNIVPGITVADGLDDYIKGKNLWVKFQSCAPIDYDADGTLAIWIGGQKISHEYYSISNDHCTLWIYRNLLDQLKSNNRYTLKARLWAFDGNKQKQTWYPATASFNVLAAGSTSSKSPKTGDESNIALWASVLVLSGGAVVALIPKKKKSGVK